MKKSLPAIIALLFVILIIFVIFFVYRLFFFEREPPLPEGVREVPIEAYVRSTPIEKIVWPDGTRVIYQLTGNFSGEIVPTGESSNVNPDKTFILKGDPLMRKLPVLVGKEEGFVLIGEYEGSFTARSIWTAYPLDEALGKIVPGEDIQLRFKYDIPSSGSNPEKAIEAREILDNLVEDFNLAEHDYDIPPNTRPLEVDRIGVIR